MSVNGKKKVSIKRLSRRHERAFLVMFVIARGVSTVSTLAWIGLGWGWKVETPFVSTFVREWEG